MLYRVGTASDWVSGTLFSTLAHALEYATGTHLYLYNDNEDLIEVKNIRVLMIRHLVDYYSRGQVYLVMGKEVGAEDLNEEHLAAFIANMVPNLKGLVRSVKGAIDHKKLVKRHAVVQVRRHR